MNNCMVVAEHNITLRLKHCISLSFEVLYLAVDALEINDIWIAIKIKRYL
jgi:hypothetical protein